MQPILNEAMRATRTPSSASYPPDTLQITDQAGSGYNPKVFYLGVGAAFPLYKQRFAANTEGVMGVGGWNGDARVKDYMGRHIKKPTARAGPLGEPGHLPSLQMLQQAIERVGKVDRAAIVKELQTGTFQTICRQGQARGQHADAVRVGQWQGGEFYGVAPTNLAGARAGLPETGLEAVSGPASHERAPCASTSSSPGCCSAACMR